MVRSGVGRRRTPQCKRSFGFFGNRGRIHSLRLHPHPETDKRVIARVIGGFAEKQRAKEQGYEPG